MSSATLRTSKSFASHTPDGKTRSPKMVNSPSSNMINLQPAGIYKPHSVEFSTKRKMFDKGNPKSVLSSRKLLARGIGASVIF